MARSVGSGFAFLVSTSLLLTFSWLQQAQAATYTISWDLIRTRGVQPPDLCSSGRTWHGMICGSWTMRKRSRVVTSLGQSSSDPLLLAGST
ncbi:unnamed protein product, partial [Closterium sp. Naga37s-1]